MLLKLFALRNSFWELERELSNLTAKSLLFKRTWVQFLAPITGSSQPPSTNPKSILLKSKQTNKHRHKSLPHNSVLRAKCPAQRGESGHPQIYSLRFPQRMGSNKDDNPNNISGQQTARYIDAQYPKRVCTAVVKGGIKNLPCKKGPKCPFLMHPFTVTLHQVLMQD